jgi:hypothetical protein
MSDVFENLREMTFFPLGQSRLTNIHTPNTKQTNHVAKAPHKLLIEFQITPPQPPPNIQKACFISVVLN